jgi:hypothetical protein
MTFILSRKFKWEAADAIQKSVKKHVVEKSEEGVGKEASVNARSCGLVRTV